MYSAMWVNKNFQRLILNLLQHFSNFQSHWENIQQSKKEAVFIHLSFYSILLKTRKVSLKIVLRWRTIHFSAMTCFGVVGHNRLHSHPQTPQHALAHTENSSTGFSCQCSDLLWTDHPHCNQNLPQHVRCIRQPAFFLEATFCIKVLSHGKIQYAQRINPKVLFGKAHLLDHCFHIYIHRRLLWVGYAFSLTYIAERKLAEVNQVRAVIVIRGLGRTSYGFNVDDR